MKKLLRKPSIVSLIIATCLLFTSCSRTVRFNDNITLVSVESHIGRDILVDTTTGVLYYERKVGYSYGITPLFNADGTLRTYEQVYGVEYSENTK